LSPVIAGSDWGQKIDNDCPRDLRMAEIISLDRIKALEEGKGVYEVDLNSLKEIDNSLQHSELFKKLYENKCKKRSI
jgi:hypothetical protein